MFSKKDQEILEQALRVREREIRALEAKVQQQDETLQNLNRVLDQQDRTMAALTSLQHLFAATASPRELLGPFLELAVKAARCEGAVLAMREGEQKHFTVLAAIGDRQDLIRGQIFNETEGIVGEVVQSGMPLVVPDARREPRLRKDGPDWIVREARNALCVPVIGATQGVGAVLLVNTIERKRFTKQDVDLLTIFTMRLARELVRESDFARAREESVRFSTLLRVGELFHVAADRQKICDLLVPLAVRMAKTQSAAVWLLDESQQTLACAASSDRSFRPPPLAVGTGVTGWVALEGKPVNSTTDGDRWLAGQLDQEFHGSVSTFAAVPVRGAKRLAGVLTVTNKTSGAGFDPGDMAVLSILAREAGVALDHRHQTQEDQRTIMELLRGLARFLDAKAPHLLGHSERVAKISQTLAEELGEAPDQVQQAYTAGLLHDLGNIGVDDEVLLAPRPLTAQELEHVRQHTSIGADILREVSTLRHLMAGPLYHHERFDGGGYPQGLRGEAIPLLARIVGVAEAFDAVRSARPYRESMSVPDALAFIRNGGGAAFDPRVVSALVSAFQRGKLPT